MRLFPVIFALIIVVLMAAYGIDVCNFHKDGVKCEDFLRDE